MNFGVRGVTSELFL